METLWAHAEVEKGTSSKTQGVSARPGAHRNPSLQRQKGIGRSCLGTYGEGMESWFLSQGFCVLSDVSGKEEMVSGKNKEGALVNDGVL